MYSSHKDCAKSAICAGNNTCRVSEVVVREGDWTWKAGNIVGSYGKIDNKMMPCAGTSTSFSEIGHQFIDHILSEIGLEISEQTEYIPNVKLIDGLLCIDNDQHLA